LNPNIVTFRDQDEDMRDFKNNKIYESNNRLSKFGQKNGENLKPKISMINMQIDQSILNQLQNDELSDAQKHELIFDILKSQMSEEDIDNRHI
jgi:uncharacterized protein with gpF-like domain